MKPLAQNADDETETELDAILHDETQADPGVLLETGTSIVATIQGIALRALTAADMLLLLRLGNAFVDSKNASGPQSTLESVGQLLAVGSAKSSHAALQLINKNANLAFDMLARIPLPGTEEQIVPLLEQCRSYIAGNYSTRVDAELPGGGDKGTASAGNA